MENADSQEAIRFYEAPLICEAAPAIGCGSKAKFMLADFEKYHTEVEGAWLNRKGTFVAIQWTQNVSPDRKTSIIKTVTSAHAIPLKEVHKSAAIDDARAFPNGWYKSMAVDDLSKEEAGIIAQNTIDEYKKIGLIQEAFEIKFKADIEKIYADLFLSISSYKELTEAKYDEIENKIQNAGEKYVGKGKMPRVELCTFGKESCEKDKSCSERDKSCCKEN